MARGLRLGQYRIGRFFGLRAVEGDSAVRAARAAARLDHGDGALCSGLHSGPVVLGETGEAGSLEGELIMERTLDLGLAAADRAAAGEIVPTATAHERLRWPVKTPERGNLSVASGDSEVLVRRRVRAAMAFSSNGATVEPSSRPGSPPLMGSGIGVRV